MHYIAPLLLLFVSNIFMTFAWYGHLKYKSTALYLVIIVSWGIAFFEYCLAVSANRIGSEMYSLVELKTIQEAIALIVFGIISYWYFGESLRWNHIIGFVFIVLAVFFVFYKWD